MQLTRTSGPTEIASACVSATMPPFVTAYAIVSGSDCTARVDATLTMQPRAYAQVPHGVLRRRKRPVRSASRKRCCHVASASRSTRADLGIGNPRVVDDAVQPAAPLADRR